MGIQISDNMRGAAFMTISVAAFVVNDTTMKLVADHLSIFQAIFLRGIFTSLLLAGFCLYKGHLLYRIPKGDRGLVCLRLIGEVGGAIFYLSALFHMPIANATAILQALPLAVTLAAAIFLSEAVGWRRYLAITAGVIGVLIILNLCHRCGVFYCIAGSVNPPAVSGSAIALRLPADIGCGHGCWRHLINDDGMAASYR